MFAIVKTGGKQIKVALDSKVSVEKLDAKIGETVTLDQVLMVGGDKVLVGSPLVAKSKVVATVEEHVRTKKVIVFKKKRRQNYRRKKGHRQHQTVLRVVEIVVDGKSNKAKSAPKAAAPKKEAEPKAAEKKVAPKKAAPKAEEKKALAKKAPTKKPAAKKTAAKKETK